MRVAIVALMPLVVFARSTAAGDAQPQPFNGAVDRADQAQLRAAQQQVQQWLAYVRSPQAAAQRASSRNASRHQDALAARHTDAKAFPSVVSASALEAVPLASGEKLVGHPSAHSAIIQAQNGHRGLEVSALPIDGTGPDGHPAPMDLTLHGRDGNFVPQSALVPVSIPAGSDGEVEFSNAGFGIRLGSGAPVAGQPSSSSVVYPNSAGTDADTAVRPAPSGAEVSYILRSPASPESETMTFALPAGAMLYDPLDGSGAIQVLSPDGKVIGTVAPPIAIDAQGQTVPASYRVANADQITLTVRHQAGDYAYPIMVDPTVSLNYGGSSVYNAWQESINGPFQALSNSSKSGWSTKPSTQYTAGQNATYFKAAPAGSYIYELTETGVYHQANQSLEFGGIQTPSGSGGLNNSGYEAGSCYSNFSGQVQACSAGTPQAPIANWYMGGQLANANFKYCAQAGPGQTCNQFLSGSGHNGNRAVFGLQAWTTYKQPSSNYAYDYLTNAQAYYSDNLVPTTPAISHSGYAPGTWINAQTPPGQTDTVTASSSEPGSSSSQTEGLGMQTLAIAGPAFNGSTSNSCSQSGFPACNMTVLGTFPVSVGSLSDGVYQETAGATSFSGVNSAGQSWQIQVDKTPPPAPAVQGLSNGDVVNPSAARTMTITSSDPPAAGASASSGPATASIQLDGGARTIVTCRPVCSSSLPTTLTDGSHTIAISATDVAGNSGPATTITFTADSNYPYSSVAPAISGAPTVGSTITASTGTWLGSGLTYSYRWQDCDSTGNCTDISGETSPNYIVLPGDGGLRLRVQVTAANTSGSVVAASQSTAAVTEDQAAVATPDLPQYDPALSSDTPVPDLSLSNAQVTQAEQVLSADPRFAQILQAAGTVPSAVMPNVGVNSWTNMDGSKLLGATLYVPLPAAATIAATWPLMRYDESELTSPPYTLGPEVFTATNVTGLLVTVDLTTNQVLEIQPDPDAQVPTPPAGLLTSPFPGTPS